MSSCRTFNVVSKYHRNYVLKMYRKRVFGHKQEWVFLEFSALLVLANI